MRFLLLVILLFPDAILATETDHPVDLIWLSTGDRVSGEIVGLDDSKLSVKTEFAGEISIDWAMVVRLKSQRDFSVEIGVGMWMEGRIERSEDEVRIVSDSQEKVVAPEELTQIQHPEVPSGFWDVADFNIRLGTNITGGNSVLRQNSVGADFRHRTAKRKLTAEVRSIISKEEDSDRINRNEAQIRADLYLRPRLFYYWIGAFESDEKSLLDLRLTGGGGIGWQLKKTASQDLSLRGGFNVIREHFRADDDNPATRTTSTESMFGLEGERTAWGATLFVKASAHPSLQQRRYRLVGDAGVRVRFTRFLSWSLSAFDRFDSSPPTNKKHNDFGIISSIGFSW